MPLSFTRGMWCMVFYCSEPAGKVHGLSCSDSNELRLCGGRISLDVCRGETLWFLEESYLNTHTVSISLSGEVVNILK